MDQTSPVAPDELEQEPQLSLKDQLIGRFAGRQPDLAKVLTQSFLHDEPGWDGPKMADVICRPMRGLQHPIMDVPQEERKPIAHGLFALLSLQAAWPRIALNTLGSIQPTEENVGTADYLRVTESSPMVLSMRRASAFVRAFPSPRMPMPEEDILSFYTDVSETSQAHRMSIAKSLGQEIAYHVNRRAIEVLINVGRANALTYSLCPETGFTTEEWERRATRILDHANRQIFDATKGQATHILFGGDAYARIAPVLSDRLASGYADYAGLTELPYQLREIPHARIWRAFPMDANWSDAILVIRRGSDELETPLVWSPHVFMAKENQPPTIAPPHHLLFLDSFSVVRSDMVRLILLASESASDPTPLPEAEPSA